MEIYLVGGAVRDQLLGYPIKERDYVVVGATPEQMLAKKFRLMGKNFPIFLHPQTHAEYALARTEKKIAPGYKGFVCYSAPDVTLEADLKRRDLTINAMAQTATGEIIDPYHGRKDIAKRVLRHVSSAFIEDPVRILRVARFMSSYAHLGFRVASETMQLMKTMVQTGEINALIPERVWKEFSLALTKITPQAFIQTLFECGALAILFPLLNTLFTDFIPVSDQKKLNKPNHLETLNYAARLTEDPQIRFAALLCPLSEGLSTQNKEIEILNIQKLCQNYRVPLAYCSLAMIAARYHLVVHRAFDLDAENLLTLLESIDAFRNKKRLQQFLLVCEANFHAHSGLENKPYPQKNRILAALAAAKSISIDSLIKDGFTKEKLSKKIRESRIQAINSLIN